jgi:hypothetical protein
MKSFEKGLVFCTVLLSLWSSARSDCSCSEGLCQGSTASHTFHDDGDKNFTIEFAFSCGNGPCTCGRFFLENDFWVVAPEGGSVRITSVLPLGEKHGMEVNPPVDRIRES